MEEGPARKLAVLMHADVVGSTALVQANETIAHQRIQDAFRRFAESIVEHGGIAHEIRGDALVAEFAKASDAVTAAVAFQVDNAAHNEQLVDDVLAVIRVGIAIGEVVVADKTVTGEGVVLAQRLEQLAEAGGVCIQGAAYETVPKRLPFQYEYMGERRLKGFGEPVRVYGVSVKAKMAQSKPSPAGQIEGEALKLPDVPSIAVLPFTNMSADPEQEFFSDGITEDIITALSRISGLLVVARNSTMVYKGDAIDVKRVGREQGVRYVLEGSVRKHGERVRVTAQLIDATTGHHQWAERYDRSLDDIFEVQDDITHQIAVAMRVQISVGEKAHMLAGRTDKIEAWERLIRADDLNNSIVQADNLEARRLLEEAVEIDPRYVSAWTELGWVHWEDVYFGWSASAQRSQALAREAAEKALELEPDYPNAHSLLGSIALLGGEFQRGLELLEKGVTLAPNNAENFAEFALGLATAGKVDEAQVMIQRALRLSPICPAWYLMIVGLCHLLRHELDAAIAGFRNAVSAEPDSVWSRVFLVSALVESGQLGEAEQIAREVVSLERGFSVAAWHGARFKDANLRTRTIGNLLRAGLPE